MKKYYQLNLTYEPEITGANGNPQVEIGQSTDSNKRIFNFFNSDEYWTRAEQFPLFNVQLEEALMHEATKDTSFLSFEPVLMGCRFLIDDDVKECIKDFNIQMHALYPVSVKYKNNRLSYWMFYMPSMNYDVVDFNKSVFFTGSELIGKKYYSVNDEEEYQKLIDKGVLLLEEKISFNASFDKTLDFFIPKFGNIYVSEVLMRTMKKKKFSNVSFRPAFGEPGIDPLQTILEFDD